jgi:hypothetical protein
MLADYFLTLLGKRKHDAIHYIKSDTYEMNPQLRSAIDSEAKVSYRHLFYVALYTLISYIIYRSGDKNMIEGFSGFIVAMFGVVNARHITNILLLRYSRKNPELVRGAIYVKHLYNLKHSLFQAIGITTMFLLFVVFSPTPFVIGAFISQLISIIHHASWIEKHRGEVYKSTNESWQKDEPQVNPIDA